MSRATALITARRLREVLHYDAATGAFRWRIKIGPNSAGAIAGSLLRDGHRRIAVDGRDYKAHRLAWFYVTGRWPTDEIDHRNGANDDNRLANLREATHLKNMWNMKRHADNSTGFKGVSFHRATRKWSAKIMVRGKHHYLGEFDAPEIAHAVYCRAATRHHGEFARAA